MGSSLKYGIICLLGMEVEREMKWFPLILSSGSHFLSLRINITIPQPYCCRINRVLSVPYQTGHCLGLQCPRGSYETFTEAMHLHLSTRPHSSLCKLKIMKQPTFSVECMVVQHNLTESCTFFMACLILMNLYIVHLVLTFLYLLSSQWRKV